MRKRERQSRPILLALAAAGLLLAGGQDARAGATVLAPGSVVAGRSIGEWTGEWWAWVARQQNTTPPTNVFLDQTGAFAGNLQDRPVFFAAGTWGGSATRSFRVPFNKPILLPLINIEESVVEPPIGLPGAPGTPQEARDYVDFFFTRMDSLLLIVDGVPQDLGATGPANPHRYYLDGFGFEWAPNNTTWGDLVTGPSGHAVADGYYVMLAPLGLGNRTTVTFGGGASELGFTTEVTATMIGVPEPASALLLLSALVPLGVAARRRAAQARSDAALPA